MPAEAVCGYLVRVARGNGYGNPSAFWKAIRRRYPRATNIVGTALRLSPDEWRELGGPFPRYIALPPRLLPGTGPSDYNHQRQRWCPLCLRQGCYLRVHWTLKVFCVCIEHGVVLLDRCPACTSVQTMEVGLTRCEVCGYDLTKAPTATATNAVIEIQRALASALRNGLSARPFQLTTRQWLDLVWHASQFGVPQGTRRTGQLPGLSDVAIVLNLVTRGASVLDDWPRGLYTVLSAMQSSAKESFSLARTFARTYQALYSDLSADCYQFLRDAFEAYIGEHWWGIVCRRNRRLKASTIRSHPQRPVGDIARESHAGQSIIEHLLDFGLVQGTIVEGASGRKLTAIPDREVRLVRHHLMDAVTLKQAARLLGLTRRRVRELIAAGLIKPLIDRKAANAATWMLSKKELQGLGRCQFESKPIFETRGVKLRQVLKAWRLKKGDFPALVTALSIGELPVLFPSCDEEGVLGDSLLSITQTREWLAARHRAVPFGPGPNYAGPTLKAGFTK